MIFKSKPTEAVVDLVPGTDLSKFYGVNFDDLSLPALVLAHGNSLQIEVFDSEQADIDKDTIAEWMFDKVFSDLTE